MSLTKLMGIKVNQDSQDVVSVVHMIGERPGNGHRSFSCYVTSLPKSNWAKENYADHDKTSVVSGISDSSDTDC